MTSALGPVLETVLAKAPPNPNDVVGGWVAFVVVIAMGAAVVFLYFSLKKQLGKVNFEEQPDPRQARREPRGGASGASGSATDRPTDRPNGST